MTLKEQKELCIKNYPDNCKECPAYRNDCENYEKGHKWQDNELLVRTINLAECDSVYCILGFCLG